MESDPDLVLLAGNFLCGTDSDAPTQTETVMGLLAPLTDSPIPVLAVLGNHDYEAGGRWS